MKIVYCLPSLYIPGGMERVLTLKANYLADVFGYDVYIIITDGKGKDPYFKLSNKVHLVNLDVNYDELYGQPIIKKISKYIIKQPLFKRRLRDALYEICPDITVSTLRREINFINSIHDGSVKVGEIHVNRDNFRDFKEEKLSGKIKGLFAYFWMRQLLGKLKKLDCFITLSNEDQLKWPELKKVITIPDPLSFSADKLSDCTSKQVIAVGRYTYQKGFDLLVKAWKDVAEKHPGWILKIYGGGDKSSLKSLIESYGLEKSCFPESPVSDIMNKYAESSIFVLSSRYEGFGMVIAEAMECGVPPVSFACPSGPKDIIKDEEDGLLVEPEDVGQLSREICYLIENEDIRKQMGRKAHENVQRFKLDLIMKQWDDIFQSLLKDKN